jgi:hypothetical protein
VVDKGRDLVYVIYVIGNSAQLSSIAYPHKRPGLHVQVESFVELLAEVCEDREELPLIDGGRQ